MIGLSKHTIWLLIAAYLLCAATAAMAQDSATPKSQFLSHNPNGDGWVSGFLDDGGNFVAYNSTFKLDDDLVGWCYNGMPGIFGCAVVNFSDKVIEKYGVSWEPGLVTVGTGMGCKGVVIRWSAPSAGAMKVSGKVKSAVPSGGKTSIQLFLNGKMLDDDEIAGPDFSEKPSDTEEAPVTAQEPISSSHDTSSDVAVSKGNNLDWVFTRIGEIGGNHISVDLSVEASGPDGKISYNSSPKKSAAQLVASAALAKEVSNK